MDKKISNRTTPFGASAKSSSSTGADSKTKQDVAANRFGRAGRRRESPCPRPDVSRKPFPQRSKGSDKRPKPRGAHYNDRDRSDIAEPSKAEVGSALQQGSKKLNLNHLLNFTYASRQSNARHVSYWGNSWRNRNKWSTKKHKYNKEQFLQANCQFVVKAGGDYAVHSVEPDPLVDWDSVELVRIPGHDMASCPICLYEPVAAKITRCGHIYCWACILHYLALSDKSWRKCPICYESIHKKDLKSVTFLSTHAYTVGETVTMRLMQRARGSVFAMVKSQWKDRRGEFLQLGQDAESTCFSKLLIATPEQVQELIIDRERRELQKALNEDGQSAEACFIESALELLAEKEKCFLSDDAIASAKLLENLTIEKQVKDELVILGDQQPVNRKVVYSSAFSDEEFDESCKASKASEEVDIEKDENPSPLPPNTGRDRHESMSTDSYNGDVNIDDLDIGSMVLDEGVEGKPEVPDHTYYFYQAFDGQHIYMHALNIHVLTKQYGSLDRCPDTITAKIVEKEGISMSEDIRKRLRYLGHLPLTCEFEVAEVDLKPPIVTSETLRFFREEIEKRRRCRTKRARDELKRERFLREEENRKLGRFPGAHLNLRSHHQFPQCKINDDDFEQSYPGIVCGDDLPALSSPELANAIPVPDHVAGSLGSSDENGAYSGPSFAQMLREGKAKCEFTVKLPSASSPVEMKGDPKYGKGSDTEDEDYVPAPEYHVSFGNAIQEALKRTKDNITTDVADERSCVGKKKKKKSKPTLLFTTSMARNK